MKFSASPLRPLRLCGEQGIENIHRGGAESAEVALRKPKSGHFQNEIIADKFEAVYIQALILNWIFVIYKFTET